MGITCTLPFFSAVLRWLTSATSPLSILSLLPTRVHASSLLCPSMVNAAHNHFREVWVPVPAAGVPDGDAPPSSRREKKWVCRHCEIQGGTLKYYSLSTSASSRMVHVKEKHGDAPAPPRVRPQAASSSSPSSSSSPPPASDAVALLVPPPPPAHTTSTRPPAAKRRKTNPQLDLRTSFTSVNNDALMPAWAALFARAGIAHHVVDFPEFTAAIDATRSSTIAVGDRRAMRRQQALLAQTLREKVLKAARSHCRSHPLTIAIDGWTNVRRDKVTNVVIICGGVAYYWCSIINSRHHNTAKWLLDPLLEVLDDIKGCGLIFSALVTDNEEVNKTLHNLLLSHYPFLIRSPCAAHLLQLCVRKAISQPTIEPIMTAMEELLAVFRHKEARLKLKNMQLTLLSTSLCLVRPNDTRWSSWLYASTRLIKLKAYCDAIAPQQPSFWVDLQEVVRFLTPFQLATDIMQSDSSTIYDLYEQFRLILIHIDALPSTSCFYSAKDSLHNLVLAVLDKHVDMDLVVACARLSFDHHILSLFPSRDKSSREAFIQFAAQYSLYWNTSTASTLSEAVSQGFAEWTAWTARVANFEEMDEEVSRLQSYHILHHQQRSKHDRIFSRWSPRAAWANHVTSAPILSLGAIALLSVAGSEAAVERTFSAQGIIHNERRNRLNDDAVEAEMYCKFNAAALKRRLQERDTGSWVELTDDYEEPPLSQLVTAHLFLTRVVEEVKAHEDEQAREEERGMEEEQSEREEKEGQEEPEAVVEDEEEEKYEPPPPGSFPSVSLIPDAPLPATADDVQRFIVDYVKKVPWKSGIHARFRWTERYRAHLSDASQRWMPPINDTDKVLQAKIMRYVRSEDGPPPPDVYTEEEDIVDPQAEPEL